VKREEI